MAVNLDNVNYILLKADGSVLAQKMDYYVQQGSTGVDKIFFGSLAAVNTDVGQAICTLPNGEQNTLAGVWDTCTYQGQSVGGFLFTLTTDQTNYNGGLTMALAIYRSQNRLVNYPLYLVINETGLMSDTNAGVTVSEINSYLQQVQLMLRVDNGILVVDSMTYEIAANKQLGQIFFNREDGLFYIKNQENYPFYTEYTGFDYVKKTHTGDKIYGTDELGNQRTFDVDSDIVSGNDGVVVRRELPGGQVVVGNPSEVYHATTKKYVDDNYVPYTGATKNVDLNGHSLETSGIYNFANCSAKMFINASSHGSQGFFESIGKRNMSGATYERAQYYSYGIAYKPNNYLSAEMVLNFPNGSGTIATQQYVDNLVATLKANAFIVVDTTTYPTLDDFLASTGEEGYIYLYPSTVQEEGYLEYIWEGNSWLQIGTTELDLTDYYTKSEVDDIADNIKADVPKHQTTTILIADPLTNINGRAFQNYTSEDVTIGGYPAIKILRDGNALSEAYAKEYMEYMTGSSFLPKYNYDYPKNTYFIMPNGQLLKPQYDSTNGLVLYYSGRIATTDYAVAKTSNTKKIYATSALGNQTTLDYDEFVVGNAIVRRHYDGNIYVPDTPDGHGAATSKKYVDESIANAISNVYRIKGSKTVAQLNALTSSDLTAGDVYNLLDSGTLTEGSLQVFTGDNVVWTGSAWDKLGTEIDWSAYDEKFIAAGFFEVQPYNESTGEITFVYSTELYIMSYDSDTGVMTIEAN